MIFFDITSSVRAQSLRPRFLTTQLFNPSTIPICLGLKCPISGRLSIQLTDVNNTSKPGYSKAGPEFAYGSEDYPNPQEYIGALLKVIVNSIPRQLKRLEIRITQKLEFPEPSDPTKSLIKFLYPENGNFIKLTNERKFNVLALVPKPGGRVTINVEVRGKGSPINCLSRSFWCPPPLQWQTFSATASIIPDTGEPYFELYSDDISLTCPKYPRGFPEQEEAQYLVTVPIFAGDEYNSPNGAASGINPKVEFDGASFPYINEKGDSFSFVVSARDWNNTFVAGIKDNVGHESERWAFKIPPEKMWAMEKCVRYPYPKPVFNSPLPAFNLPAAPNSPLPASDFFFSASDPSLIPGALDNKY